PLYLYPMTSKDMVWNQLGVHMLDQSTGDYHQTAWTSRIFFRFQATATLREIATCKVPGPHRIQNVFLCLFPTCQAQSNRNDFCLRRYPTHHSLLPHPPSSM